MRILLVEDNLELARLLKTYLSTYYVIDTVSEFAIASDYIDQFRYDIVLLDRNLNGKDIGMELISKIKSKTLATGIIIISAYDSFTDKIFGLDLGADDYLDKPFNNEELRARISALGRRHGAPPKVSIEGLECDTLSKTLRYGMQDLPLSKKESELFFYLLKKRGHIVSKEELLDALYLNPQNISSNTLDVTIGNVRRKLPFTLIKTIKTRGYIID
jgi:DNA-binding response OmpR family regulator